LILGAAAGTPGQTGKQVTLSFRTQTDLSSTGSMAVSIQWPAGYLLTGSSTPPNTFGVLYSSANTFAAATSTVSVSSGQASFTISVGSAGAPAGSYTITLTGVTIGLATVSNIGCTLTSEATKAATCIRVSTTSDDASLSSFPSILPRGQVQGVSVSVLETDRVPSVPNKPITISFTTQTDLVAGNAVTIRWPTFNGPMMGPYVTALSTSFTTNVYWTGPTGTFSTGNPLPLIEGGVLVGATLTVSTTAPKGAYVVVLLVTFGRSSGQTQALCSLSDSFSVATARDDAGFGAYPPIGLGRVTNVQLTLANPVPGATRRDATVTFTVSAPLGTSVTMTWPPGYFYGFPIRYEITGPGFGPSSGEAQPLVSEQSSAIFPPWVIPSRYFNGIFFNPGFVGSPGTYTIRLSNLALGTPVASFGPFVNVFTPQNDVGSGNYPGAYHVVHLSSYLHIVQLLVVL